MIDHSVKAFRNLQKRLFSAIHIIPMSLPQFLLKNDTGVMTRYRSVMRAVMVLLGANVTVAEADIAKVIENEQKLARFTKDKYSYTVRTSSKYFEEKTLGELNEIISSELNGSIHSKYKTDLIKYVNNILDNPNIIVNASEKVLIPRLDNMIKIFKYINSIPKREQANLMLWRILIKVEVYYKSFYFSKIQKYISFSVCGELPSDWRRA